MPVPLYHKPLDNINILFLEKALVESVNTNSLNKINKNYKWKQVI